MEWISVKERVPEVGTTVIAWMPERWRSPGDCFEIVTYSENARRHRELIRRDGQWWHSGYQITHWMPLPEPPHAE